MDPARIDRAYPQGTNFEQLVAEQQLARLGDHRRRAGRPRPRPCAALLSSELKFRAADLIRNDPSLIGQTVTITAPVSDDADLYYKGEITRATAAGPAPAVATSRSIWLDRTEGRRATSPASFNTGLFTNGDSTEPELAGVLGAVVGSALMLLVTALIAIPLGRRRGRLSGGVRAARTGSPT